ncbi:hypothetical protein [Paracoccus aminovorans]|uniref:hypothetical protein n=1 Tax=Paracoccus aminovorans TaxID=34004 RepID=UPI002B25DC80|nr:hypothetical protein [Paracoccus aminovorans]
MQHQDDPRPTGRTYADETSQTRFGPRPVPPGHHPPHERQEARRTPPHGDVSPDGQRPWPHPSRGAKWLVWGGTALTAAALTAGTVYAARHLADALGDDKPRSHSKKARPHAGETAARLAHAGRATDQVPRRRSRAPRQSLMQEIESNTASLTQGVDNVMRALTSAVIGFREVAGQAGGIMREFGDAAALVQDILGRNRAEAPRQRPAHADPPRPSDRHGAHMPDLRDDPLMHDPLDGPDAEAPGDHDPRIHRL